MNIVLLNGPPRSGKDTIARGLQSYHGFIEVKFASPLWCATRELLPRMFRSEPYEDIKTKEIAPGVTVRDLVIAVSEKAVKPTLGHGHFGKLCAVDIMSCYDPAMLLVFSDSGFVDETVAMLEGLASYDVHPEVLLVHLHREGKTFDGDSRSYWTHPDIRTVSVFNNERPVDAVRRVAALALGAN